MSRPKHLRLSSDFYKEGKRFQKVVVGRGWYIYKITFEYLEGASCRYEVFERKSGRGRSTRERYPSDLDFVRGAARSFSSFFDAEHYFLQFDYIEYQNDALID